MRTSLNGGCGAKRRTGEPSGSAARPEVAIAQDRKQVGDRLLPPVDLAVLRRRAVVGSGNDALDAIEMRDLAAGEHVDRLLARHVAVEKRA